MILQFEQIQNIVANNPNKENIAFGRNTAEKLMLHVHGVGMDKAIKRCQYFVSEELHKVQKEYAISNKDFFGRLLQQEDMVFNARGGSTNFSMPDAQEKQMNIFLEDVRYGMSLRKWVKNFALQAYRCDPMGIIFMEIDRLIVDADGTMNAPKVFPTYKSIYSCWDYLSNGRRLEYVCFRLKVGEAKAFGIIDDELKDTKTTADSNFYRFVDDAKDLIVKNSNGKVTLVTSISQPNPLPNPWTKTPGFVVSDIVKFNDPQQFVSPLDLIVELADCFLNDRSVRDLQKKYHGFAKAVEPLLTCGTCAGAGYVDAAPCKDCTPPGAVKGTGFKMKTKVSDVAKFPISILEEVPAFDFRKIFGYATPDIEGWEKQDSSLEDLEEMAEMTYWGTVRMKRASPGGQQGDRGQPITATESESNEAPKEARLNTTADWAEKTESMIAEFIGRYWFDASFKKAAIIYGRDYVLKTPERLMEIYQDMRTKGAPDFSLDEALEKYYQAKYQNNPAQMAKYLKMLDVEPFPHIPIAQAKGIITDFTDYNTKLYFGEWSNTIQDIVWITTPSDKLREKLKQYVTAKNIKEPAPEPLKVAA